VDTPDGKPTAEWLVFRKHIPYLMPLEETEEWGETFQVNPDTKYTCFTGTKIQILTLTICTKVQILTLFSFKSTNSDANTDARLPGRVQRGATGAASKTTSSYRSTNTNSTKVQILTLTLLAGSVRRGATLQGPQFISAKVQSTNADATSTKVQILTLTLLAGSVRRGATLQGPHQGLQAAQC
jgi:hypothetical protein